MYKKILFIYFVGLISSTQSRPDCCIPNCSNEAPRICILGECCIETLPSRCFKNGNYITSTFIPRSQGANLARQYVGLNQAQAGCSIFNTFHTFSFTSTFKPDHISRNLFGTNHLNFAGSDIVNRGQCQLIGDYFGLSPHFKGRLIASPRIQNFIFENQLYFRLDKPWLNYIHIFLPIVHTRWDLNLCQITDCCPQCPEFNAGYMSPNAIPASCNIKQAVSGNQLFGDMKTPWEFGRFHNGSLSQTGLAEFIINIGSNFWQTNLSHLGLFARVSAPTGNRLNANNIFQPIVGNGGFVEAGGGIDGHLVLWSYGPDHSLTVYITGYATHLFKIRQKRSFDFCNNGPLSRYLLLKEFNNNDGVLNYSGNLINAIDFNTRIANVSVSVKGEAVASLSYASRHFCFDIGYNFFGKTRENIEIINQECSRDRQCFGIKGTADSYAIEHAISNSLPAIIDTAGTVIPLNTTQCNATECHRGTNDNLILFRPTNCKIALASRSRHEGCFEGNDIMIAEQSNQPTLINSRMLNPRSAEVPAQASHKLFWNVYYFFDKNTSCESANCELRNRFASSKYLALGAEFEVNAIDFRQLPTPNIWGIWLKGGFVF